MRNLAREAPPLPGFGETSAGPPQQMVREAADPPGQREGHRPRCPIREGRWPQRPHCEDVSK